MADSNPSENVRAMLTQAQDRLRKASADYFDLLERGLSAAPSPVAEQAKQFCNFMQQSVNASFELGDKLIQARDVQDALRLQAEFFQGQMQALTEQARGMGESAMRAATGIFGQKS